LRIAIFGDSFTHGDDVPYEESFGSILARALNAAGLTSEVLNFGMGGYGTDQAMLRYREQGAPLAPRLVVLGFQPENIKRNLNLIRPVYDPRSGLPFAKPRFILDGNRMALINVPVLPLDQIIPTLRDIDNWELQPYEYYYDPRDYQRPWWRRSKLLAVTVDLLGNQDDEWFIKRMIYQQDGEDQRLAWAIIEAFASEVTGNQAQFLIVHLPSLPDLEIYPRLGKLPYQSLLDALDERYHVVRTERQLLAAGQDSGFANLFRGHYTWFGNRIVAEAIFNYLFQQSPQFWQQMGVKLEFGAGENPGQDQ
jgi:hypothetical protein